MKTHISCSSCPADWRRHAAAWSAGAATPADRDDEGRRHGRRIHLPEPAIPGVVRRHRDG